MWIHGINHIVLKIDYFFFNFDTWYSKKDTCEVIKKRKKKNSSGLALYWITLYITMKNNMFCMIVEYGYFIDSFLWHLDDPSSTTNALFLFFVVFFVVFCFLRKSTLTIHKKTPYASFKTSINNNTCKLILCIFHW